MFKKFSSGCRVVGSCLIRKKGKLAKMTTRYHSLSFVVTLCHSLLLVVSRFTTHYQSFYHSLSFVVTRCTSCCYSLLLDVSLVCRFINAHFVAIERLICFSFLFPIEICWKLMVFRNNTMPLGIYLLKKIISHLC